MKKAALASLLAAAAASDAASGAGRSAVTPLQKVIQMLTGMSAKGKEEKHAEEVQYAAYKQWCDSTTVEKQRAIAEAKSQIEMLKADILKAETDTSEAQSQIQTLDSDVATFDADLKAAAKVRETERADYTAVHKDYSESIDAIEKAVQVLKSQAYNRPQAASETALLQTVEAAAGAGSSGAGVPAHAAVRRALESFLERGGFEELPAGPPEAHAYEFRSHGVVEMLEKLRDKFVDERSAHEKEEMNKRHAHELFVQDTQKSIKAAETTRAAKVAQVARSKQSAATMKGDLQDTTTAEADDTAYLSDLTATCSQKARDFTDRQKLRADEISAIEQAIEILGSDAVSGGAKHLPSAAFLQAGGSHAVSLVQERRLRASPLARRAATFLAARGQLIQSRTLVLLAQHMQEDPFAKVKKMITDLINRLLEEGNEEAQRKGWCDTELASNEAVRTQRTQQVERLSNEIDQRQASIMTLGTEISQLADDLNATAVQVAESTKNRQAESAQNAATVKDAREAQAAVGQAITVLREFYQRAAESTALSQVTEHKVTRQAPAVFEGAYTGMGAENGGVISMLEVIQSDFARLESTTSADESTAQADYDKFMRDAAVAKAAKQTDMDHKKRERQSLEQLLVDGTNDRLSAQKELDAANKYYEKLKPTCLNAGESFAERTQRREEEIQSLQEALRILNGEDISVLQKA
eukprot:TRINITY_DN1150_c0_g2_i1.p1 TRINITY_DN1150_c0_g2~~TRINITY_DN1150_c0_g2_i1.p1  ORF type:complete len:698 (+),score=213.64 TRINITY_DN1150_c0_g2_i1:96-2189(+)